MGRTVGTSSTLCGTGSLLLACSWVMVLIPSLAACPSGSSWPELREQATAASSAGRFREAEDRLRTALSCLPDAKGPQALVLMNELGESQESQDRLSDAEATYRQVLKTDLSEPPSEQIAIAWNNLGTIALRRNQLASAEQFVRRSYSMLEQQNGLNSITSGHVLSNLALILQREGRLAEAEPVYPRALAVISKLAGENSLDFAKVLTNCALFNFDKGNFEAAIETNRKALAIEERLQVPNSSDLALTRNNLGLALSEVKRLAEAEPLYYQALAVWRTKPEARLRLAETLSNLSMIEKETGRTELARQHATEAINIVGALSDQDPLLAAISENMGMVASAEGNWNEAREWYQRAADIWLKSLGQTHPSYAAALSNLAGVETKKKHFKAAQELYGQAYEIDRNALGPNHPRVAADLSNMAAEKFYLKHLDEAVPLFERSRELLEHSFGPDSRQVAEAWRNLALVYWAEKQCPESELAFAKAIRALEASSNAQNPVLSTWLQEYAVVLRTDKQFALAEQAETRALGIQVKNTVRPSALQNSILSGPGKS
ncbi:MAG: tetratricopeptide repeat protein [Acidobacteriaceae bacterium]|nr:tetratricopeptide repeat protein [Acidobacteriaceae bacterium]